MKLKFEYFTIVFVWVFLFAGPEISAREKTKRYNESWPVASVQTLEINNKFGEVKITNRGGSEISINVLITVEAPNDSRANELLSKIKVDFEINGDVVKAETFIDNDFKSRNDFSIDYLVNIPSDKNLDISNKYGNTIVNVLSANGSFDIQYGNFIATELNAPVNGKMDVFLAYGKADVSLSNNINVDVKYSTMNFGETGNMKLNSKYTVINLGEARSVEANAKYDTFNFEKTGSLSGNTKYTHIKIDELTATLDIVAGYGGVRVNEVAKGFESISITNSYGQVFLGLRNNSYTLDASCEHCGITYPEDNFVGNQMKENNTGRVIGKVGSESGGNVMVKSRYGQIKLN